MAYILTCFVTNYHLDTYYGEKIISCLSKSPHVSHNVDIVTLKQHIRAMFTIDEVNNEIDVVKILIRMSGYTA